jgi:hypothetical protein
MSPQPRGALVAVSLVCVAICTTTILRGGPLQPSAEAKAVAFLEREVPRWRREHPCYSCHNNGDAARALIAAGRRSFDTREALADTLKWLSEPERWHTNAQGGGFEDLTLSRIQFASALTDAKLAGLSASSPLATAAALIARDQDEDGAWRLDVSQSIGSPATYGTALATWSARRTLAAASRSEDRPRIARTDRWLRELPVVTVLDAAAVLLGLQRADDPAATKQRGASLAIVRKGQAPDGGWGPYVTSPSEPFDTAVVLLALVAGPSTEESRSAIARGRAYLLEQQLNDGSWPETTRPARQESYAQRISTTAWATLALFGSAPPPGNGKRNDERLGLRGPIAPLERIHFEGASDAIPRHVFEHR